MLILLDYNLFYIGKFSEKIPHTLIYVVTSLIGVILCFVFYQKYNKYNIKSFNWLFYICVGTIIYWAMIVLHSVIKYDKQPFIETISEHISLLYIVWTIPLLAVMYSKKGYKQLFMGINIIAGIWYILLIVQFVLWIKNGTYIFNNSLSESLRVRTYGIRIGLGSIGNLMIIYNFNMCINFKKNHIKNLLYLWQVLSGIFCMIFVQQTRAYTAIVFVCMAVMLLSNANRISKKILVYVSMLFLISYLFYSGIIYRFISSFFINSYNQEALGTSIRLGAVEYYMECFLKSPLVGNGFTNYKYYPLIQYKYSGVNNLYFYSDVGIFGLLAETGLGAVVFFVIPFMKMWKILKNKRPKNSLLIGLFMYLVLSSSAS